MISLVNIRKAMRMVANRKEKLNYGSLEKQLASTLNLYQDRKEYDGSLNSAIHCLELAGYVVDHYSIEVKK